MKIQLHTILFTVLLFVIFVPNVAAQSITSSISDDSLRAGDLVTLSITLDHNQEYDTIIFPDSTYFKADFELRKRSQYRITDFKDSLTYKLQFWGVSNAQIAALPVKLVAGTDTTTLYTNPVNIAFQTVIKAKEPKLRPLKPIFDFARTWWFYIIVILLIILAALAIWYFYKKQQDQTEQLPPPAFEPRPFLDPLRELENNLEQLKTVIGREDLDFKQFYIDLGDAIRLYFEQMYKMPALESTSGEILAELNNRAIDVAIIKDTRSVLNEADMVKFAKFEPTNEQAQKALDKAHNFHATVKEQHQNRILAMRKQHFDQVEQERQTFNEAQKQEETV